MWLFKWYMWLKSNHAICCQYSTLEISRFPTTAVRTVLRLELQLCLASHVNMTQEWLGHWWCQCSHGSYLPQPGVKINNKNSAQICPYLWVLKVRWFSNLRIFGPKRNSFHEGDPRIATYWQQCFFFQAMRNNMLKFIVSRTGSQKVWVYCTNLT